MQTGLETAILCPVGSSVPVCGSIRKTTMLSPSWLATRQNVPVGSMLKFRGVLMPGGLVLDERQRPLVGVDPVHRDAVVPAIGAVEELAARVHANLGARARSGELVRQRRDRLNRVQRLPRPRRRRKQ